MQHNGESSQAALPASSKFTRRYIVTLSLIVSLAILSIFWGFYVQANRLINEQILQEARAFFQEIVLTRQWVASYGGVYVPLHDPADINPYLKMIPGLKVTIQEGDGTLYTLKNPALVTREISELAGNHDLFSFHITSLKPLNPANHPDEDEIKALRQFENGATEVSWHINDTTGSFFRYMAPLVTTAPCLECHAGQGYQIGDIRGGISVTIPSTDVMKQIRQHKFFSVLSGIGVIALVLSLILYISHFFIRDLRLAEKQLVEWGTRDFLTGLLNRREGLRRLEEEIAKVERADRPLSCSLLDIDFFKQINDYNGHLAGDQVLKELAIVLEAKVREYDILCRYGGEEFLLVMPDTPLKIAEQIAERLREEISQLTVPWNTKELRISISLGVGQLLPMENIDDLISRVDEALYLAKKNGRNQVQVAALQAHSEWLKK